MNKGIILTPKNTLILGKHGIIGKNNDLNDILFSLIMNEKAYIFNHLITENNYKTIEKFQSYGLIEILPQEILLHSLKNMREALLLKDKFHALGEEKAQRETFIPINYLDFDYSIGEAYIHFNEYINFHQKSQSNDIYTDRIFDRLSLIEKENISLIKLIKCFQQEVKEASMIATKDFIRFTCLDRLNSFILGEIEAIITESKTINENSELSLNRFKRHIIKNFKDYKDIFDNELELQRNYISLKGFPDNFLDYNPSKQYVIDYIDLIESKVLLEASLNYSSENAVNINIKHNLGPNEQTESKFNKINSDNYDVIYKMVLENINFPSLNNIEDLLQLKDNSKINLFKKHVDSWNQALKTNEFSELKRIEKHLIKANKSIESLKINKQDSWFFLFSTLGLGIIDVIAGTPFSITPTIYSIYKKSSTYIKKRKYNWLITN